MRQWIRQSAFALFTVPFAAGMASCFPDRCEDTDSCGVYQPPPGYCAVDPNTHGGNPLAPCEDAGIEAGTAESGSDANAVLPDGGADGTNDQGDGRVCDRSKTPGDDACVIDEISGVFVSPLGSDANDGTRSKPIKTLATGLSKAHAVGKRLYVCDDGTGYPESITISAELDGIQMFGGFNCDDWSYAIARRAVVKPASGPALVINGTTVGVLLEGFELDAADATMPGASSIAAIADAAIGVELRRVKIMAGKGGAGQAGVDGMKGDDGLPIGAGQKGTDAACPGISMQPGGFWASSNVCGSRGGAGGSAFQESNGTPGAAGIPDMNVTSPGADNGGPRGMNGGDGSPGNPGGPGAAGTGAGMFTHTGYTSAGAAGSGADGYPGQGGGGGGASNAPALSSCIGASGGAGGMGGCGGKAGSGGAAGGASVALLAWMSDVTLDACDLIAQDGGAGGKGGNGGQGGLGQDGAPGGAAYAADAALAVGKGGAGGKGGNGGPGGPGAGGNGGPSYALVYKGQEPAKTNGTTLAPGAGGAKGAGGKAGPVAAADAGAGGSIKAPDGSDGPAAMEFVVP